MRVLARTRRNRVSEETRAFWCQRDAPIFGQADIVAEATELRLSFKNILKIDNLQGFQTLGKRAPATQIIGRRAAAGV